MKKVMKSLLMALALIAATVLPSVVTVSADDTTTYTITVNTTGSETYEAYQIFSGDVSTDNGSLVLANMNFGSGIAAAKLDTFKGLKTFEDLDAATAQPVDYADAVAATDGKEFADLLVKNGILGTASGTYSSTTHQITGLAGGYYIIKSSAGTVASLQVAGNVTLNPKTTSDISTVEKTVKDLGNTNDATAGYKSTADLAYTDALEYQIKTTIPTGLAEYTASGYKYVIHDTLDSNIKLSYNNLTVKAVKADNTSATLVAGTDYTVTDATNGKDIEITNLPAYADYAYIVVTYDTTFADSAKTSATVGKTEYPGSAVVEYSVDVYNDDSQGNAIGTTYSGTALSSTSTAVVFNYTLKITKTKEDASALEGAGFTVTGTDYSETATASGTDNNEFIFYGLRDGVEYTIEETTVPTGYNKAANVTFTITEDGHALSESADYKVESSDNFTTSTTTLTYTPATKLLTTTIANKKGTVLPSTGGQGTMLLVGGGAVLILAAGLFLVTNKRIAKENL